MSSRPMRPMMQMTLSAALAASSGLPTGLGGGAARIEVPTDPALAVRVAQAIGRAERRRMEKAEAKRQKKAAKR